MSFATIAGWLFGGFAMRLYAMGAAAYVASEVIGVVRPAMHAAGTAMTVLA